ncbi:MAG: zinc metalloprotease HtpX [Thermincola sp.]|jgi:heat shock protein HtpX|nr:zinc metalloprotease HtpX [Thermincola sp.]MDT3704678.1 zinc metalloprotease HtpX [Thermincola sp.]
MSGFGNQMKTVFFLGLLTVIVVMIGGALGGRSGLIIALGLALVMNGVSYWYSDKIVIKMTGSQPLSREQNPNLYDLVEGLAYKAGIPTPKIYITPSHQPNAFATGRNPEHGVVAVTQGLMQLLTTEELKGVIAHELAHIKNRDILVGTVAAVMAGVITTLANMAQWALLFGGLSGSDDEEGGSGLAALPLIILGPIAALLVQMAISRSREYLADSTGADISGSSEGLAMALLKLEQASQRVPMQVNPAASHMFIVNPLRGRSLMSLFSTHPPIAERVNRLKQMRY